MYSCICNECKKEFSHKDKRCIICDNCYEKFKKERILKNIEIVLEYLDSEYSKNDPYRHHYGNKPDDEWILSHLSNKYIFNECKCVDCAKYRLEEYIRKNK